MSRWLRNLLLIFSAMILQQTCTASDPAELVATLNQNYRGKSAMLRGFYCDSRLEYDVYGNHVGTPRSGPWTVCAYIKFKEFKFKDGGIEIQARRSGMTFSKGKFVPVDGESVMITLASGQNATAASLVDAMNAMFYEKEPNLIDVVPEYWKCYLAEPKLTIWERKCVTAVPQQAELTGKPFKAGAGVSAPRPISTPDPGYTKAAQKAGLRGKVTLRIDVNESGKAENINIADPLGLGLDEAAVAAVKKWTFEPAKRGGTPVRTGVTIEVNF